MIPVSVARVLELRPPLADAREVVFETAEGPTRVRLVPSSLRVTVIARDVTSKTVTADAVISPLIDEPLVSDMLAGELEISVEDSGDSGGSPHPS